MIFKNQVLGLAAVALLALASCKKDIIAPEQATNVDAVSSDAVANDVPETASPLTKAVSTYVIPNSAGYYEVLPARYSLTTKSYPLILFIHGIGELGTGPSRLSCCGIPFYANKKLFPAEFNVNGQRFSFVVFAPQFKKRPTPADVQNAIAFAVKKYRIDQTRIYVAGLSMGGGSTWDYSAVYGQNIAAAVPVCGGTAPTTSLAKNIASKNLPVWTISSKSDAVVPISWATNWIAWIKKDNPGNAGNVKLTVYTSGESHNTTWSKAFAPYTKMDGLSIYEWMLKFRRTGGGISAAPTPTTPTTPSTPAKPTTPTTPAKPTTPAAGTPTANAGSDITIHKFWNFAPLLNGTLSKIPGGWFVSSSWAKVSGPASYKFASGSSTIKTRVSGLAVGTYVFRLTVKTNKGASASDEMKITVLP